MEGSHEGLGGISKKSWWDPVNVMEGSRGSNRGKHGVTGSFL